MGRKQRPAAAVDTEGGHSDTGVADGANYIVLAGRGGQGKEKIKYVSLG